MSRSRLIVGLLVIAVLAALGYAGYQRYLAPLPATPTAAPTAVGQDTPSVATAEGKVIPAREAALAFRSGGRVAELLVQNGDIVEAGAILVRLESAELEATVAQAEAAVALAQAQLDQLLAGARPEQIAAAEAQYNAAQAALEQAIVQREQAARTAPFTTLAQAESELSEAQDQQAELQTAYDQLIEEGNTSEVTLAQLRSSLAAANDAVAVAQARVDQLKAGVSADTLRIYGSALSAAVYQRDAAKANLDLLKAGPTQAQVSAAQAQLTQAQAKLDAVQAQLAQTELVAPFAGTVVSLNLEVGEVAAPGAPVLVLADETRWRVLTNDLSETDVALVRHDQRATVTLDAFPDQMFNGVVTEIASLAEVNRGSTTYAVTLELDPTEAALRWGMTAFVDIQVER
jgi:HlyD family secretion protein